MTETAAVYQLDPHGDPRIDALCEDIEEYVIRVASERNLTYITAVGALDYVRYRLMRNIDDEG